MSAKQAYTIFDEYQKYLEDLQAEYGPKSVVLMEVGSFYEMYALDTTFIDLPAISDLLNIQVTRRNKGVLEVSRTNHLLAGFPAYCLEKFTNTLLDDGYTVGIVNQVTPPPKPKRALTSVRSPGTRLDNIKPSNDSFLLCAYTLNTNASGISYVDLSTGATFVFEASCEEELFRIITAVAPKEVLLLGEEAHVRKILLGEVLSKICVHTRQADPELLNIHYQRQLLQTVYPKHGLLSVIEYLDLERRPLALTSFVALLRFAHKHSERILTHIQKPTVLSTETELVISFNACLQLNVIGQGKTLVDTLNRCKTAIGRRHFRHRLLHPTLDCETLGAQYDAIDTLITNQTYKSIRTDLSKVSDLERAFRRIQLGTANPMEFPAIIESIECITHASSKLQPSTETQLARTSAGRVIDACACLNLDNVAKATQESMGAFNLFVKGTHPHLDTLEQSVQEELFELESLVDALNKEVGGTFFKLEKGDKEGYYLLITTKRLASFKKQCSASNNKAVPYGRCGHLFDTADMKARPVSASSSSSKIPLLEHTKRMEAAHDALRTRLRQEYAQFLQNLGQDCADDFKSVVDFVARLDYATTNACNAVDFCYCRPKLVSSPPFVDIQQLRHPIIERIQESVAYVPNDVQLGCNGVDGMLLYGVNASGKSSLMKSVGLALIMACSGMYVPCTAMTFSPFSKIFTRIPSGDDMSRGHSTFTNEVSELRSILKNADAQSLVIGDELCSGTESVSGMAIVAAGIQTLVRRNAAFIFASHLHDLVDLPQLQSLPGLKVYHLSVLYEEASKRLVYYRKLEPGRGNTLYGLEVCKALDLDPAFMELAQEIRHHVLKMESNIVSTKKSRYNSKLFKGYGCGVCGCTDISEVHHIIEQNKADARGAIGGRFKKNALHNLVYLCKACHLKIHTEGMEVKGYVQTSEGRALL
jgi:DNA mismatch repair protein MutS